MEILAIVLGGILWRLRGIMGWPFTLLFSLLQVYMLLPALGNWAWLAMLIMVWEGTGWEPKHWDWVKKFPWNWEPNIKLLQNPTAFKLPFWSSEKYLLNWSGAWIEVWFGMMITIILQLGIFIYGY